MTTDKMDWEKEDYLDRFAKVEKGLKLNKNIGNKIANFIHYEIMTAKKQAHAQGVKEGQDKAEQELTTTIALLILSCGGEIFVGRDILEASKRNIVISTEDDAESGGRIYKAIRDIKS